MLQPRFPKSLRGSLPSFVQVTAGRCLLGTCPSPAGTLPLNWLYRFFVSRPIHLPLWQFCHCRMSAPCWQAICLSPHSLANTQNILHPWDFPGKSTGAGCHFLLQGTFPTQESALPAPHPLVLPTSGECPGQKSGPAHTGRALITSPKGKPSVLAWRIPGTGEPGGLPSTGSRRVGHD